MKIGRIYGTVYLMNDNYILLDTSNGVCYTISIPAKTFPTISLGSFLDLFIYTTIKEDAISLYGFTRYEEMVWFSSLLKVSGVGAKTALSVISSISLENIESAIRDKIPEIFKSISGLGEKTAQRIVNDLKTEITRNTKIIVGTTCTSFSDESYSTYTKQLETKTQNIDSINSTNAKTSQSNNKTKTSKQSTTDKNKTIQDAISAMKNLGFSESQVISVVSETSREKKNIDLESLISLSLKKFTH